MVGVLYSCFSIPDLVRQELIAGTFDRLLLSPFGGVRSILAMTLFPLLYSFLLAALTLGLGCAVFGLHLHWSTVPLSVPVMALALLAFLPFGLLFAALTVQVKQGSIGTSWVIALLSIIGGLYFPVSLLPHWLRTASQLQPFTSATSLLRHLLVGSGVGEAPAQSLLKLALFAAILVPASLCALSIAIRVEPTAWHDHRVLMAQRVASRDHAPPRHFGAARRRDPCVPARRLPHVPVRDGRA